jgi:acyl-CoA hydrolase
MCATPTPLIDALVARGEELRNVEIVHAITFGPAPHADARWVGHFHVRAVFVSDNVRSAVNAGRARYAPIFLSYVPTLFRPGGSLPVDVALIQVSPPDKHGYCSLGPSVDASRTAAYYARKVVALINPRMPRTHGDSFLPVDRLDYAVEWDGPLYEVPRSEPDEVQRAIGRHVAELIEDGATLQLGIGAIPDAVLQQLTDRRDLGVHTEMFSDGVMDLAERGVITGVHKVRDRGKIVSAFVIGSRRLMDFIDDNPRVELRTIDYTNDPQNVRQFDHFVAVNSALQVDLTGQVCAESLGTHQYSGVGGQMDFMQGATLSKGGRPILALPATSRAPKGYTGNMPFAVPPVDGKISRISPTLSPGAVITTTRAHVHYVVTEYGTTMLLGRSIAERARSLIGIAAPQFRADLERAAYDLGLLHHTGSD